MAFVWTTRVGSGKVPDAKTLGKQAVALGPEVVRQSHQRLGELAIEKKVVQGRKRRVDTTVVKTNIHNPTAVCSAMGTAS